MKLTKAQREHLSDLARVPRTRSHNPIMTMMLNRLVKMGLAERDDGFPKPLYRITPAGRSALSEGAK